MTDLQAYAIKGLTYYGHKAKYSIDLKAVLHDPKNSGMYAPAEPSIVREYARKGVLHDLTHRLCVEWRFAMITYTVVPTDTGHDVYTTFDGVDCISRHNSMRQIMNFIFEEDFDQLN